MRSSGTYVRGLVLATILIVCCGAAPFPPRSGQRDYSAEEVTVLVCEVEKRGAETEPYYRVDASFVDLPASGAAGMQRTGDVRVSFPTIWTRDGWQYECVRSSLRRGGPRRRHYDTVKQDTERGPRLFVTRTYGPRQYIRVRLHENGETAGRVSLDIEAGFVDADDSYAAVDREKLDCQLGTPLVIIPDSDYRTRASHNPMRQFFRGTQE